MRAKRAAQRQRTAVHKKNGKYKYESRHQHAQTRQRNDKGRFLTGKYFKIRGFWYILFFDSKPLFGLFWLFNQMFAIFKWVFEKNVPNG